MELRDFVGAAQAMNLQPEEYKQMAGVAVTYWDLRRRGALGIKLEDVSEDEAEVIVQNFTFDASIGLYVCPQIEHYLDKVVGQSAVTEEQFESFWRTYPRKVAKANARKVWLRKVKTGDQATKVIQALRKQIEFYGWQEKERHQFVPHAATWLGQERWADELDTPETKAVAAVF